MTAVGRRSVSTEACRLGWDYAAALAMLAEGDDPVEVHRITKLPLRVVLTLWDSMDGEASGTMRRFGSVIDPRYRPRGDTPDTRRSRARAKLHSSTR
jgi:hypothetical protein